MVKTGRVKWESSDRVKRRVSEIPAPSGAAAVDLTDDDGNAKVDANLRMARFLSQAVACHMMAARPLRGFAKTNAAAPRAD